MTLSALTIVDMRQLHSAIRRIDWESSTDDHKIVHLGELHVNLDIAHPFRDGNGKTARISMSELVAERGTPYERNTTYRTVSPDCHLRDGHSAGKGSLYGSIGAVKMPSPCPLTQRKTGGNTPAVHELLCVELWGIEPQTFALRTRRSTN